MRDGEVMGNAREAARSRVHTMGNGLEVETVGDVGVVDDSKVSGGVGEFDGLLVEGDGWVEFGRGARGVKEDELKFGGFEGYSPGVAPVF